MTCIVAVKTVTASAVRIVMGGDSAGVSGIDITVRRDPKVFRKGEFLIGFTTSFRMGQIIRFKFDPPPVPDGMDLHEYMIVHFVDAIRAALKQGGFAEVSNGVEKGGCFIVGVRDRLFTIQSDFQVSEALHDFAAVGCGTDYALGALAILSREPGLSSEAVVRRALEVAVEFSGGVRPPFTIMSNHTEAKPELEAGSAARLPASVDPPAVAAIAAVVQAEVLADAGLQAATVGTPGTPAR